MSDEAGESALRLAKRFAGFHGLEEFQFVFFAQMCLLNLYSWGFDIQHHLKKSTKRFLNFLTVFQNIIAAMCLFKRHKVGKYWSGVYK